LNNEEGYLKGASTLLIDSTNAFLQKNLSRTPKLRLQSVAEMRVKIEELKRLRQRIELENSPKRPNVHFVCRDKEISYIDEYLQRDSYVILEGIGGIGKTELAKKYAWENRGKYDIVQFITYSGDLQTTVAYSMNFRNFDNAKIAQYESKYGNEAVKYIYRDKISSLKQEYHGKRTLIVVDNYNAVADDHFTELVSWDYKVIFTSREKHNGNTIEITEMTDERDLLELFSEYYAPGKLSEEQVSVVLEIIGLVLGHTMTLMLIATAMQKSMKTPAEMLARLQSSLDPKLRTKIAVDKEGISAEDRENVVSEHIRNLFNMEEIIANGNYSFIMTNMAIIPYTGVDRKTFYLWALSERYKCDEYDDEDYTDIDSLIDHRWIQYDGETHYVSLHPVISDLAYRELKPDSVKCSALIRGMIEYAEGCFDKTYIEHNIGADMLQLALKRIVDKTKLTSDLYYVCASIFDSLSKPFLSAEIIEKALKMRCELFGEGHADVAKFYNQAGIIYNHMYKLEVALDYYEKALSLYSKLKGKDHSYTGTLYYNIGIVYRKLGKYDVAMDYAEKALAIRIKQEGESCPSVANVCSLMGKIHANIGEYEKALEYFNKSFEIYRKIYSDDHPLSAAFYRDTAVVYRSLEEYDKALAYNEKALKIMQRVYGDDYLGIAGLHNNIGVIYSNLGYYEKALEAYNKSLRIFLNIISTDNHPEIATAYYNIGRIYYKMKDNGNAFEFYQMALAMYEKTLPKDHPDIKEVEKSILDLQS
jgi:tetratricopeptide (TPR) repeat protein